MLPTTHVYNHRRVGPAGRWYAAHHVWQDDLVLCLDDDVVLGPDVVRRAIAAHAPSAISWWCPDDPNFPDAPTRVPALAGGIALIRAGDLHDLEHPLAERHLAFEACDDLFVSWWLHEQGLEIVRPRIGHGDIELQKTPVSRSSTDPRWQAQLASQIAELERESARGWRFSAAPVVLP